MKYDEVELKTFLRDEDSYQKDILENNSKESGIKSLCIFNDLPSFFVTDNFVFDLMHDVYEGVFVYDVCNMLLELINSKVISLSVLNGRKQLFQYGELEINNASIALDFNRLKQFNLKMTASEVNCFIFFLPLMIADLVPKGNKHWIFFFVRYCGFTF